MHQEPELLCCSCHSVNHMALSRSQIHLLRSKDSPPRHPPYRTANCIPTRHSQRGSQKCAMSHSLGTQSSPRRKHSATGLTHLPELQASERWGQEVRRHWDSSRVRHMVLSTHRPSSLSTPGKLQGRGTKQKPSLLTGPSDRSAPLPAIPDTTEQVLLQNLPALFLSPFFP